VRFYPIVPNLKSLPPIVLVDKDVADVLLKRKQAVTRIRHVVSIGTEGNDPPDGFASFAGRKLRLEFDDVEVEETRSGYVGPSLEDARRVVAFGKGIDGGVLLVHCAAGISRSSASLLILLADRVGPGREDEAVRLLVKVKEATQAARLRTDFIRPNRRLVWLGDAVLGRDGALLSACTRAFADAYAYAPWSP
jgi:predicted protein tyrosine phosphatase